MKKVYLILVCFALIANTFAQGVIDPNFIKVPVVTAIPSSPPANSEGRMVFVNTSGNKQLYVWNGTTWAAVAGSGGGSLTPPISLTGTGTVLSSSATDATGKGLVGLATGGTAVEGNAVNGVGLAGYSTGGTGIYGQSTTGNAGSFLSSSNAKPAFLVRNNGTGGTAVFTNDAPASLNPTLYLGNQGDGRTLEVINLGKGFSGFFDTQNAAATAPALYAGTFSTTQPAARLVGTKALQVDGTSHFNGMVAIGTPIPVSNLNIHQAGQAILQITNGFVAPTINEGFKVRKVIGESFIEDLDEGSQITFRTKYLGAMRRALSLSGGDADFDGNITRGNYTNSANLVPIAYGTINANGTILNGTGNFTISSPTTGNYRISINGISVYTDIVCIANYESAPNFSSIYTNVVEGTYVKVSTQALSFSATCGDFPFNYPCINNNPVDTKFSFIAYKP